mmetsp:Transcript_5906/g.12112  ORF Transcript_5906/g.12112 Transcript_5906/m.12112 type:complete len:203 (-) Transcript_5906:116-724(-)
MMYAYLSKFLCLLMISLLLLLLCVDAFHFVTTTTTTTTTRIRQQLQRGTSIHGVCVCVRGVVLYCFLSFCRVWRILRSLAYNQLHGYMGREGASMVVGWLVDAPHSSTHFHSSFAFFGGVPSSFDHYYTTSRHHEQQKQQTLLSYYCPDDPTMVALTPRLWPLCLCRQQHLFEASHPCPSAKRSARHQKPTRVTTTRTKDNP